MTYSAPPWQRALVALTGVVIGVVTVGALYWAQLVFIPIALAIFLTFLLNPLVVRLQRRRLGRIPSVLLVVLASVLLLGSISWLVSYELSALAGELPDYTQNVKAKIKSLREAGEGSVLERLKWMVHEIGIELDTATVESEQSLGEQIPTVFPTVPIQTAPVVVQPEPPVWFSRFQDLVSPIFEAAGLLALAGVLAVFMLLNREDLRDRLIRLLGNGRITVTTKAFDEAAQRISRFLLMQAVVNGTYGMAVCIGLSVIGVDYAVLWGFLAAVLRYVPYLGAWVAAILPIGLSLAMFEGWWQPVSVIGLFVLLELVSNNLMEPWLYGQSIGVSEVAFLVAAAFWTFLWGPIGLILSAPLTVCLVILGKFVPQLEFLDVLLGDQPALEPNVRYYQRALARDEDEATDLALEQAKETSLDQVFDTLLIPALTYARRDLGRDNITSTDEAYLLRVTQEVVEELADQYGQESHTAAARVASAEVELADIRVRVFGYAARDDAEEVSLEMLRLLLASTRCELELIPATILTSELLVRVDEAKPDVVCVASLPPGGLAHTRYVCKKLRARFPTIKIIVGRWGLRGRLEQNRGSIQEAGADLVATSLHETLHQIKDWLPVLAAQTQNDRGRKSGDLVPTG